MKDIKQFVSEALNQKKWEDSGCPVMYSIYGKDEGPWYFGYTDRSIEGGQMKVWSSDPAMYSFAKIVIPFDQFDAYNLTKNLKFNLIK